MSQQFAFKPSSQIKKPWVLLLLLVALLIRTNTMGALAQDTNTPPGQKIFLPIVTTAGSVEAVGETSLIDDLIDKVRAEGAVKVIVELKTPTPLEDEAADSEVRAAQQTAIAAAQQAFLAGLEGYTAHAYTLFETVPHIALQVDEAALRTMFASSLVANIQEDRSLTTMLASSTAKIKAPGIWAQGYEGTGQTVVIIDTGIEANHPFFGGRVVQEACFSNSNGSGGGISLCPNGTSTQIGSGAANATVGQCLNGSNNLCSHGTHVAGIAAGSGENFDGVARNATIIAIQVFTRFNTTAQCLPGTPPCFKASTSDINRALAYVNNSLSNSYSIAAINMSLGGGQFTNQTTCDTTFSSTKTFIDALRAKNIATVIAAGNDSGRNAMSGPGCISSAIGVSATTDENQVAAFSNMHIMVDLLAPGVNIDSAIPGGGFASFSGTSMASPHVAGAWAILQQKQPGISVSGALSILQTDGISVKDNRSGGSVTRKRLSLMPHCSDKVFWLNNNATSWNDGTYIDAWWDLANCVVKPAPSGSIPFVYDNKYYVKPKPTQPRCPSGWGWYDGANCYLGKPINGKAFLLNNTFYFQEQ